MSTTSLEQIGSRWWLLLLQGIILVAVGIWLFAQPGKTLVVLALWLGISFVLNGVLEIILGITGQSDNGRVWAIIGGLLTLIAGCIFLANPVLAGIIQTSFVVFLAAFLLIASGVIDMISGTADRYGVRNWSVWGLILGLLKVILGIFLLFHPTFTGVVLLNTVSIIALVMGVAVIVLAFQVRSVHQEIKAAVT